MPGRGGCGASRVIHTPEKPTGGEFPIKLREKRGDYNGNHDVKSPKHLRKTSGKRKSSRGGLKKKKKKKLIVEISKGREAKSKNEKSGAQNGGTSKWETAHKRLTNKHGFRWASKSRCGIRNLER